VDKARGMHRVKKFAAQIGHSGALGEIRGEGFRGLGSASGMLASASEAARDDRRHGLEGLLARLDNSLMRELEEDPEADANYPNTKTRPVMRGHFVKVQGMPLKKPFLITYSEDMAARLGLTKEMVKSKAFLTLFSANTGALDVESWVTPYAVSVYGQPIASPDPFNGRGYGDGRACSIGEFVGPEGERFELQLKGSGPTPFARQFDGRAVLRSSIREFLASEAMFAMSVPTTRALSLIGSEEMVDRAWYRENVISQEYDFPPNHMIREKCAITCRAASSFLRVGQVELYARRLYQKDEGAEEGMRKFLKHCINREYPHLIGKMESEGLEEALIDMVREFCKRQTHLVTNWIRVGYIQGNMNSDNCLLGGQTMDYGPFGFIERYHPLWTPFTSDPERKFGFERQRTAAHVNAATLVEALIPFIQLKKPDLVEAITSVVKDDYVKFHKRERSEMTRSKLGLSEWTDEMELKLWEPIYEVLLEMDYTIFFRELSNVTDDVINKGSALPLVQHLQEKASYESFDEAKSKTLADWLTTWFSFLQSDRLSQEERQSLMKSNNPKYIPREWQLVQVYEAAQNNDFGPLREMQKLLEKPCAEQEDMEAKYYQRTPEISMRKAGTSFFSCSS